MGTFIKSTNSDDTKAVLELLEASHLALEAGKILIEAKEFYAGILKNIINSNLCLVLFFGSIWMKKEVAIRIKTHSLGWFYSVHEFVANLQQIFRLEFGNVGDGGSGDWLLVSLLVVIWLLSNILVSLYFLCRFYLGVPDAVKFASSRIYIATTKQETTNGTDLSCVCPQASD
ncbi:hypothetical protein ACSBR2_023181 [Camellia fascicularis]